MKSLSERIRENRLAAHFHGNLKTLCAGYHSPTHAAGMCVLPRPESNGGIRPRPGLSGACHGQCIRRHQEMGLKPAATNCTACHQLKETTDKSSLQISEQILQKEAEYGNNPTTIFRLDVCCHWQSDNSLA
ncbi:MAG: hypothetical protein R2860_12780 [Desulfobacterales bacterium]